MAEHFDSAEYFDSKETRSQDEREADHLTRLRALVADARARAPYYAESLSGIEPGDLGDLADLAKLPVVRKSALIERQQEVPPFGGLAQVATGDLARLFLSPGPIAEPQGEDSDIWRAGRALFAAGFRRGEVAHNCFAYHFTPAGIMFDFAARTLGCAVFPGGVGQTEAQVEAMNRFQANGYMGTPDFLKIILERGEELGTPVTSLSKACVTAGPLFPELRQFYEERGIHTRQCYATADIGLIAYESETTDGMVLDEDLIVEIVRPGTGDPVTEGEVGEVVVTCFNPNYPLIRFATGDLSAFLPDQSPCGRTNRRIRGWMGRADQTTKVRGMFVHPEQIDRILKSYPAVTRGRLEVSASGGKDTMVLRCEIGEDGAKDDLAARIAESIRVECRLRGEVAFCRPGDLPNDGKVIDDQRPTG